MITNNKPKINQARLALVVSAALFCSGSAGLAQSASGPFTLSPIQIAQDIRTPSSTILPTDIVPLPAGEDRSTFSDNLQLRMLQRLPSKFYFAGSVESSFRYETNVFQYPTKRSILNRFASVSTPEGRFARDQLVKNASRQDTVFRVLPNITAGWAFTPRTRVFANYFLIKDSLFHNTILNTTIQSVGGGVQHDFPLGKKANLQATAQFRELFQSNQIPVFDFLPGVTLSYLVTPRTVAFTSILLQMRGKQPFVAPNREIDPFFSFGTLYQKGPWAITSAATFLQNFREPFRRNALIPVNNYSWILDFEVARRVSKKVPGLQAFVRAEPIFNFHSNATPGLSGNDFRLFYGLRMTVSKPALTGALKQIRQQLEEEEVKPPSPFNPPPNLTPPVGPRTPSGQLFQSQAELTPHFVAASSPQPIHGYKDENQPEALTDTITAPAPLIAESEKIHND